MSGGTAMYTRVSTWVSDRVREWPGAEYSGGVLHSAADVSHYYHETSGDHESDAQGSEVHTAPGRGGHRHSLTHSHLA